MLKKKCFMLGLIVPIGIMTQAEEEDMVHTLEVVVEVDVKVVVEATIKTKANMTPRKIIKIIRKRGNNRSNAASRIKCYRRDKFGHFVSRYPDQKQDYEANLNETQEGVVNHEEGMFFMMNHLKEMIFINEEKYNPPKIESNAEEDYVCNVICLGKATISNCDIRIQGYLMVFQANIDEDSWLWHVRLHHIGYGMVILMHKLAKGVPIIKHQEEVISVLKGSRRKGLIEP
ncbi:hypothetical protein Tco_0411903 [Tanacetum coccineum]